MSKFIATKNVSITYKIEAENASEALEKIKSGDLGSSAYSESVDIKEFRQVVTNNNQARPERRIVSPR